LSKQALSNWFSQLSSYRESRFAGLIAQFALESGVNPFVNTQSEPSPEGAAMNSESSLIALMEAVERGDKIASGVLFASLYDELHRLAKRQLNRHGYPLTLSATTLLHEAYMEMAAKDEGAFSDEARFLGYAACVMRGLIIDYVRNRQALKRGGGFEITSFKTDAAECADGTKLSELSAALDGLATAEPRLAQVVDLKFFCGFSFGEIASMHGVSERTVQRQWEKARMYLHRALRPELEL
jgi:RNA polymerase sigma factor (TIGR02999 family)